MDCKKCGHVSGVHRDYMADGKLHTNVCDVYGCPCDGEIVSISKLKEALELVSGFAAARNISDIFFYQEQARRICGLKRGDVV